MIQCMSGFVGDDMSFYGHAEKGEISKTVQKFMPDKFIRVS